MIHVDNLTKYYGPNPIIKNITFYVDRGDRVGLFGPYGAGKTTLMRILTAYTPPSEGTVTVSGYDVFTRSMEVRKRVGYLPQNVPLYTDMTVYNYLDYVATLRKVENRFERIWDTITLVSLTEQAQTRIGKLSKDMRRRVGLAQAIIHKPDLLILDEPTLGLTPQQIVEMQALIESLGDEYTVLLGTRTLTEAEQICNRVLMMNKGSLIAEDTPAHLSARLEGGQRIRLKTSSAPGNTVNILQALDGVGRVLEIKPGVFDIECMYSADCRPAVADLAVQQGWGLLELQVVGASLEDIFLDVSASPVVAVA